jgi:hypothetical protein
MPDYELVEAELSKTFTTANGQFNVYRIVVRDANGEKTQAEMNTKSSSPAPPTGPITGTLENTPYGWKFKKTYLDRPGGGGGGGRPTDPKTQAKIVRQHSQATAVAIFAAKGKDFTWEEFTKLTDSLDDDVESGAERSMRNVSS